MLADDVVTETEAGPLEESDLDIEAEGTGDRRGNSAEATDGDTAAERRQTATPPPTTDGDAADEKGQV